MIVKNLRIFFAIGLFSMAANAQIQDVIFTADSCSYFGEKLPAKVTMFEADTDAVAVTKQILDAVNLTPNFEIKVGGVPNAAAIIIEGKRYIMYDQFFMRNLTQKTGTKWAAISVMAHEVGHHLNGHTLDGKGSRPTLELEADRFSGGVLQKMGATLLEARSGMESFGSESASQTHPAKRDRLAAITNGWLASCDKDTACKQGNPKTKPIELPPSPPPLPTAKRVTGYIYLSGGAGIEDVGTGLVWQNCSIGQIWNGTYCTGIARLLTFDQALSFAANGWRVPSARELNTLLWCSSGKTKSVLDIRDGSTHLNHGCDGSFTIPTVAPAISVNMPMYSFWSSSVDSSDTSYAYYMDFYKGGIYSWLRNAQYYVRLVR
jgi:hypothetical protein